jgi:hemerythrin-like metal-binding protein
MALFRWRDNLSLGHPSIDADHKTLIDILNRLHFMAVAGDDETAIGRVLSELIDYTRCHFRREEALMQAARYPKFAAHQKAHHSLTAKLNEFEVAFASDPQRFDVESFYDFVADWLLVHVMTIDMKLKPYLKELSSGHIEAA